MSYSDNATVNDIVLTVINDGDGKQCGASYAQRCDAARAGNYYEFGDMARAYGRYRLSHYGATVPARAEWVAARDILFSYYVEHVAEIDRA